MSRRMFVAACALALATTTVSFAQQTTTTVTTSQTTAVQNPDGTWTVIEYPTGKEVLVDLTPVNLTGATGRARIHRMSDGTMINLDLSGLTNVSALNVYAVDHMGHVTHLGPVNIANGAAVKEFRTTLDRFMLVLSPETNLTTIAATTPVHFRSAVPQGFAVVPLSSRDHEKGAPVGEKVSAVSTSGATSAYSVPMLNIPGMARGEDTELKVNLSGALTGARVNFDLEPRKDGPTMIKARFHEMKEAPAGKVFVLWAVSPDNKFVKLGQVVNTGNRNEAEIRSETTLPDFGLLITLEDEYSTPVGAVVGTVIR